MNLLSRFHPRPAHRCAAFILTLVVIAAGVITPSLAPLWADAEPFTDDHLAPYNEQPLGSRTPLILIHGIGPEKGDHYNWFRYIDSVKENQSFRSRFKIYLFHFDPAERIDKTANDFVTSIAHFYNAHNLPDRNIRVVALSQGGVIIRKAYRDPLIRSKAEKILTIATPFHGTPLANRHWMKERMKQSSMFSPVRHLLGVTYHFVGNRSPHFENDYCWDNVDQSLNQELNHGKPLNCHEPDIANDLKDAPFITYGSFFGLNKKKSAYLLHQLELDIKLPKQRSAFLFSRARLFSMTQNKIEKMPLANVDKESDLIPLMVYNDGITPISSSLWLGRFINLTDHTNPQKQLWQALSQLKGKHTARLFFGMDHQDWMLNHNRSKSEKVRDLLNPDEPERDVFDWFTHDLLSD